MDGQICQSCGMPLKDEKDLGTNEDSSKNSEYCHFCYKDGKFSDEGITLQQKIDKNVEIAVKMGISEEDAKRMADETLPTLKRWR